MVDAEGDPAQIVPGPSVAIELAAAATGVANCVSPAAVPALACPSSPTAAECSAGSTGTGSTGTGSPECTSGTVVLPIKAKRSIVNISICLNLTNSSVPVHTDLHVSTSACGLPAMIARQ